MLKKFVFAALCCATGGTAWPVAASTVQTTMPVTALTLNACVVVASPMAFGTLNQIAGTATDSQTTVVVTCTPGTGYNIGMDLGANSSGGVRQMQSALGGSYIPYHLYSDAARSNTWGNVVGTNTLAATAGLLPTTLTVYGRVPANAPLAAAGVYSDVVTVTVTF